jgi:hypothetical protein
LGANRVIDYRAVRFEENASEMDVVFDSIFFTKPFTDVQVARRKIIASQ